MQDLEKFSLQDESSGKEEDENEDEYLSDGRKKGVRTVHDTFPEVKVFKVANIQVKRAVTRSPRLTTSPSIRLRFPDFSQAIPHHSFILRLGCRISCRRGAGLHWDLPPILTRIRCLLANQNLIPEGKKKPPKYIELSVKGLGWNIVEYTESGLPSVDSPVLKKLVGDKKKEGEILKFYKSKG